MRSILVAASLLLGAATAGAQPVPSTPAAPSAPPAVHVAPRPALLASMTPAVFAAALQRAGFTAEVKTEDGHTYVLAKSDATPFQVFLSNCQAASGGCTDMELFAGFTGTPRVAWERINGWNARTRFGRAFLDENHNPALQMDLSLLGGVSQESLKASLETWKSALGTFSLFLVARTPPAGAAQPPGYSVPPGVLPKS